MTAQSILIVDDDVQFGRLVKRIVSRMGHTAEQISRPRDIIDRYDTIAPDTIFVDIFMLDFDGIDVANWLSKRKFNGKIVFMTGRDSSYLERARKVMEDGGDANVATLEKPFRVNEVRDLLT